MAEYRIRFTADTSAAGRSISDIQKAIKAVTKEFEKAEIGAEDFADSASNLSKLKKELNDARSAVVNVDKAYQSLNKAIDANFAVAAKAGKAAEDYNKKLLNLAEEQLKAEDQARRKNFQAEVDDWDKRFNLAVAQSKKIAAKQRAIMEFRAGMGARGAIPAVASPIRGTAQMEGSPAYYEAINKAAKEAQINAEKAQQALSKASSQAAGIAPPPQAFSPYSLAAYEAKLKILKDRARVIAPDAKPWRELTKEILKTENAIENINKRQRRGPSAQARLGAAGGAFLYGGGFSGAGSAIGGITGGLMGGVPGAFTGAAIGQAVDSMTAFTAAMTEQAVAVQKLRLGLASASNDLQDYAQSVREVEALSNKLLLPLDEVTRKFTQLKASTVALGIDAKTTSEIFEGTAAAVLMSGGSLEDVDGAMRAVVQVFSKGKLTAEELRGQLGERLPGAVVEFARSSGRSLQELDKAFEQGGATLDEFVIFLREKKGDTEDFVREMATSSEFAGARMAKAFERMRINIGRALQPTGAAIQDFIARSINGLDKLINKAIELKLIQPGSDFYANRALQGGAGGIAGLEQQLLEAGAEEERIRAKAGATGFGFIQNYVQNVIPGAGGKTTKDLENAIAKVKILEDALKKIRREEGLTKKREEEITNEQERQKKDARAQKFLDAIERREEALANARENYEQEIRGIRENAIKQAEALERRYKDQRLQDEREIGRVRRELAAAIEEENLLRRGIAGEDPALLEQERKIGEAIRQYTEDKISREEEAQDRQIAMSRELEDFKRQNADAINKANERYANAIGKIQQEYAKSVAKLIEEGSGNGAKKLAAAGKLIAAQIARASAQEAFVTATGAAIIPRGTGTYEVAGQQMTEAQLLSRAEKSSPNTKTAAKAYVNATKELEQAQKELNATMQVTAKTATVSLKAVSTADLEAGVQARIGALTASLAAVNKERTALSQQGVENTILGIVENIRKEAFNNVREIDRQNEALIEQVELIKGGTLPSLAEEASLRGRLFDQQRNLINAAIDQLSNSEEGKRLLQESATLHSSILADLTKELDVVSAQEKSYANIQQTLRDNAALLEAAQIQSQIGIVGQGLRAGFINEAGAAFEQQISQGVSPEVAAQVARATEQLMLAKQAADALQSSIQGVGSAFGEALTTGVASLISGTATAKEVFANFLQSVGQALSQAASQMIATYISIGIAKIFAGLSGGGLFGGSPSIQGGGFGSFTGGSFGAGGVADLPGLSGTGALAGGSSIPSYAGLKFASGGIAQGGFRAFANGGVVSGPTLGLVGEGKYNEAIVPLPDGRSIPVQLGSSSSRELLSGGVSKQQVSSPVLSMSFQTTKFGDREYVDVTQLEAAMAETRRMAAREGAAQGSQLALSKLRNSPSTRRQLGLG